MALLLAAPAAGAAAPAAAPNSVSLIGTAPNTFVPTAVAHGLGYDEPATSSWVDPVSHLLFQYNASLWNDCPGLVVMDPDTFATRATLPGCGPSFGIGPVNPSGLSVGVAHAEDSAAHVLFAADNSCCNYAGAVNPNEWGSGSSEVYLFDEQTLKPLTKWTMPMAPDPAAPPFPQTSGISYYAPLDELLVLDGNIGNGGSPGVAVTAISVSASRARGKTVALWTATVPQCAASLLPAFAQAAPYHSSREDAIYVPCALQRNGATESDGVVKVPMVRSCGAGGCTGGCQPAVSHECPDASRGAVAVAPGLGDDTVFDPTSDRMFLPSTSSGEVELLVYDGKLNTFMGAVTAGGATCRQGVPNCTAIGFDASTGRIYLSNSDGMWLMDARRTPVALFGRYPEFARTQGVPDIFPVLAPDSAYPYTRVIVPGDINVVDSSTMRMPNFIVYADTSSAQAEPKLPNIDSNTLLGPPPAGSLLQETFHGVARGYGFHSDFVGGPNSAGNAVSTVNGANAQTGAGLPSITLPLGKGNRDLLGGVVGSLTLHEDGADGAASPLSAADDSTNYELQQCSDVQQVYTCLQQPQCSSVPSPAPCPPPGVPTQQPTAQQPPFPVAVCSQPGDPQQASQSADGGYYTSWQNGPDGWKPTQSQIPGFDSTRAHAKVSCLSTATGEAWLNGTRLDVPSVGTITIGGSTTTSSIAHTDGGKGVGSAVTATARGIVIDLGPQGKIAIADVLQEASTAAAGKAGTAGATSRVYVSGVTVNGTPVCGSTCDLTTVTSAINQAFPSQVHVSFPQADDRYMSQCAPQGDGSLKCLGSPGGYIAAVESSLPQQYGDEAFNGMTSEVASFLPAMRVILYLPNDGNPSRTREVLDLAGVQAESADGFSALAPAGAFPDGGLLQAFQAATGAPLSNFNQPIPMSTPPLATTLPGGPVGTILRLFRGIVWLFRSPLQALQMTAFLAALAVPGVLALRRRAVLGGAA